MINAIPFKWVVKISRSVEMKKKRRVEKFEVLRRRSGEVLPKRLRAFLIYVPSGKVILFLFTEYVNKQAQHTYNITTFSPQQGT